jgi:hypothetical protein
VRPDTRLQPDRTQIVRKFLPSGRRPHTYAKLRSRRPSAEGFSARCGDPCVVLRWGRLIYGADVSDWARVLTGPLNGEMQSTS